jgi:hypothetical protein
MTNGLPFALLRERSEGLSIRPPGYPYSSSNFVMPKISLGYAIGFYVLEYFWTGDCSLPRAMALVPLSRTLVQLGTNILLVFTTDDEQTSLRCAPGDTESTKARRKTKGQRRKKVFLVPFALHLSPASSVSAVPLGGLDQRNKLQRNFRRRVLEPQAIAWC